MIINKPEPEKITITVRDLDVAFDAHDIKPLTLYPRDELTFETDGSIRVVFVEKSQGTIVLNGRNIRWYSLRTREISVPKPAEERGAFER
jgi:hypothetical protein